MAGKKSFLLRMNPKLYEAMEKWAADEFRSVNGHIEYILREAALRSGRLGAKKYDAEDEIPEKSENK
ncbi:MAG: toxin-antitoxin system HicB family antitoxin [Syntrophomonadaceae bacterium]|jgi:hypothetical protein|nr:toxin-antitoxin system HicB family antitoxin [Syntrophomonadaceae bacterium]